jgi:hypothetical protein
VKSATQPSGEGEKLADFAEQFMGVKLYPYQRDMLEAIMSLPPAQRFAYSPARRGRLSPGR